MKGSRCGFAVPAGKSNEKILLPQEQPISLSPENIISLVENLKEIQKAYPYVASMDIYYEGTRTIVTGYDKVHFPVNDKEVERYLPWYAKFEKMGVRQYFFGLSYDAYPGKEQVLTYVKRISEPKWKGKGIIVAFHLSPDSLWEYIDKSKGIFVMADSSQRILFQSGDEPEEAKDILHALYGTEGSYAGVKAEEPDRPIRMKLNGEPVIVFSNSSQATGLDYVYYMPEHTLFADYQVNSRIFLINFGFSILFNILMLAGITWLNYFIYRRRIVTFSEAAGIEMGEKKKSFDQSLTALTSTITDLGQTVKSSEVVLEQNSLRSLLLNRNPEEAYERLFSGCTFPYVCCFMAYYGAQEWEGLSLQSLKEAFLGQKIRGGGYFSTLEKGQVIAAVVYDSENGEQIRTALLEALQQFGDVLTFVSGAACELSLVNVRESYLKVEEAACYRFIYPGERRLSWEELKISERKSHGSHLKIFASIEKDINGGDFLDFKYHIEALKVSFQTGNYTIDYCQSTLRDLVTLLYQMVQRYSLNMWGIYGYDLREYYKQLTDIEAFCEWADQVCEILLVYLRQKKTPESTDLKSRLEQTIEERLEKDISLDYLSDCFFIRPDVLSRTFRQLMGKSYTEYVKEKKLNRALVLIDEDYSMKEIASRLGYSSPQYFIKVFKESYGVTPYRYKKKMKSEQ